MLQWQLIFFPLTTVFSDLFVFPHMVSCVAHFPIGALLAVLEWAVCISICFCGNIVVFISKSITSGSKIYFYIFISTTKSALQRGCSCLTCHHLWQCSLDCPIWVWGSVSVWQYGTPGLDSCFNYIISTSVFKIPCAISSVQRMPWIFKRLRVRSWRRCKNPWPEGTWGEDTCVRSRVLNIHKIKRT